MGGHVDPWRVAPWTQGVSEKPLFINSFYFLYELFTFLHFHACILTLFTNFLQNCDAKWNSFLQNRFITEKVLNRKLFRSKLQTLEFFRNIWTCKQKLTSKINILTILWHILKNILSQADIWSGVRFQLIKSHIGIWQLLARKVRRLSISLINPILDSLRTEPL